MTDNTRARVAIADDHHLIREGIKLLLKDARDLTMVGEAASAAELQRLLSGTAVDILVLDIALPDKNGLEVITELRATNPKLRILALSMHPEERYARRALMAGAAGYINKAAAADELLVALRRIMSHGRYISPDLAAALAADLGNPTALEAPHQALSNREYQVLLAIAGGRRASELSGTLNLSINTINTYKKRLLAKLNLRTTADLIHYAVRHNLIER